MTTSDFISEISDPVSERHELLLRLMAEEGIEADQELQPIPRQERDGPIPLSFAQKRLWILHQMAPESPMYNLAPAFRLQGPMPDQGLWEHFFNRLVKRHESLRTTFTVIDGEPHQVISATASVSIPLIDLTSLPVDVREMEATGIAAATAQRPFDLVSGPLFRVTLVRLGSEDHVMLLTMHHIIVDAWSVDILIREIITLGSAYDQRTGSIEEIWRAFDQGLLPAVPSPSLQYADYAIWQNQRLQGEVLEKQLSYWRQQLKNVPTFLELPTDFPRPTKDTSQGKAAHFHLPAILGRQLKALCQQQGVTPFMLFLAAFKVLLHRYTGQTDLLVGVPVANRDRPEAQNIVGFFVNMLVLRSDLSADPTFLELLEQVQQVTLDAQTYQELPFEKLVQELNLERNLSHHPLIQVVFSYQDADPTADLEVGVSGLKLSPFVTEHTSAKFDLTMVIGEGKEGLQVMLEYKTDLFGDDTIRRLIDHYQTLLSGITTTPTQPISYLPLLSETVLQRQLVQWNDTAAAYPRMKSLAQLFAEQVARTPDAVALVYGETQLTYAALNRRANQLAHRLRSLNVGPDVQVGLSMARSPEMVVAILAILKAGGAYLPLDPTYPEERLAFMLEDARAPVLITDGQDTTRLPRSAVHVINLNRDWPAISQEPDDDPPLLATAANLAYVMYTSGSTGRPKGVSISQQAISRLVFNPNYVHLDASSVIAQASNSSFDAATFEIWGALLHGGRLVGISKEVVLSPARFVHEMKTQALNTLFLTTALFNQIARQNPSAFSALQYLFFGGEAVNPYWVRSVLEADPPQQLIHVYGPTESTTFATWYHLESVPKEVTTLPIGFPLTNTQVYLLDTSWRPVPVGVTGELYIGGEGLARCYFNQPGMTATKFVPHPFSQQPGERLYRTGDLARYRSDGSVEFLGRQDDQIKIRGYRIELSEIESVMEQHPAVRETAVVAYEKEQGDKRLVAYVVIEPAEYLNSAELRAFISERLPEYMIPVAFVVLEALPLSPNGKIDRGALPDPYQAGTEPEREIALPHSPIEQILVDIWGDVLNVAQVDIHDDFFELGGHSLFAMQVVSRVRAAFQVELPLLTIFEAPTVAKLAKRIQALLRQDPAGPVLPLRPQARTNRIPLSFAQQRLWFLDQFVPDNVAYNIPSAVRLQGLQNVPGLAQIFNRIVARHEVLRTTFIDVEGVPYQQIAPNLVIPLPLVDLRPLPASLQEQEIYHLAAVEAQRPFDLSTGPLLRTTLLQLAPDEHILLLTMHHIIADGWSIGIFLHEIQEQLSEKSQPLPPLPVQYADYTLWQRQWFQGEVLDRQRDYWRKQLQGPLPALELPTDRLRSAVPSEQGAIERWQLPAILIQKLQALCRETNTTLFMVILAAFKVLFHRYTQQDDIIIGTPIAGRNREEIEGLIGFFVNTLALRSDLSGNPSFLTILDRVRKTTLEAFAHQDLPFEKLIEELGIERDLAHTPVFQVMFALQNAPLSMPTLPGVKLSVLELEHEATKFDLTLMATEKEQGLDILLAYKTDLFNASTIRVLLRQYQTLLAHIVASPAQQLSALPLLTENEQLYWTQTWNNSTVDYPQNRCIQALFEQQVLQTPEAIALQFGSERLTYRQLNERANQLAHTLRKMGIAPGVLVGLYMEHSIETIIGLMGVLKAGGAYVPLDPAHPAGQLVFMLGDADISLLLTQQHLASYFTAADIDMLCLDSQWDRVAEAPVDSPTPLAQSQDLVYVIYTSGSTGRPKGVKIQHANLVNYIWWASQVYLQGENLAFPLYSSLSFDLTATSIFTPLITGNKIVIYRIQGWEIADIINDNQVDILKVTPSHLALIKDNKLDDSRIKRLIIGGEALETELARQIHDGFGQQVEIFNEYGPTEATVGCMIYRFDPAMDQRAFVPIGKPAANMHIYILDEQLAPVAENVTGELYIAGAGLAAGYWRRPELTDERFVNNPFVPGTKMYKTGDMARMLATGNIEFIGRQDEQVKFRGYRVELNAIRSELKRHSDIRDSVVLVDKDQKGHDVMVAYYVSRQALDAVDLRTFLARHVIEETIPNIFIHLKRLPLTLNGKVDYRGLPPWREVRQQAHGQYVAPRNPAEEILADIWTQVLEIEQIGIHDNFFALGGHSLLATQVISRIRTQFQVDLPLRTLFEAPTIAEMVAAVLHRQAEQVDSSLLAEMLSDLDELTEEELQALLAAEGQFPDGTD